MEAAKKARPDLNLIFKRRGLSRAAVASRAGIKRTTLRQQLAKGFPRQRLRLVMEAIADVPIWSAENDFLRRKALRLRLHFDPYTVPANQLRRQIPGLQLKGWRGKWKRSQIIELLERKFLTTNAEISPNP